MPLKYIDSIGTLRNWHCNHYPGVGYSPTITNTTFKIIIINDAAVTTDTSASGGLVMCYNSYGSPDSFIVFSSPFSMPMNHGGQMNLTYYISNNSMTL